MCTVSRAATSRARRTETRAMRVVTPSARHMAELKVRRKETSRAKCTAIWTASFPSNSTWRHVFTSSFGRWFRRSTFWTLLSALARKHCALRTTRETHLFMLPSITISVSMVKSGSSKPLSTGVTPQWMLLIPKECRHTATMKRRVRRPLTEQKHKKPKPRETSMIFKGVQERYLLAKNFPRSCGDRRGQILSPTVQTP
jgi:hypothetical protein